MESWNFSSTCLRSSWIPCRIRFASSAVSVRLFLSLEGDLLGDGVTDGVTTMLGVGDNAVLLCDVGMVNFSFDLDSRSCEASLESSSASRDGGRDVLPDLVVYSSFFSDEEAVMSYGVVHFPNRRVHCWLGYTSLATISFLHN